MKSPASPQDLAYAVMLADVALVLLTGIVLGRFARRLRQPVVIGEIAAGIVLGPSVLGRLPGDPPHTLFPAGVLPLLSGVAQIGLVLFMFVVGWEFEKRLVRPHAGLAAGVSLSSVALAFGVGVAVAAVLYPHHSTAAGHHIPFVAFATFMGTAMSVTAFPVLARILSDNRLQDTPVGALALASAAIDDVLAWCMLAFVSALVGAGGNFTVLLRIGALSAGYAALMFFAVRPLVARLVWRLAGSERWTALLVVLCAGAFLSAWLTTWIGIHDIFGAFLFGFVMPREPGLVLAEHLRKPIDGIGLVLLPVFFIVTGLGVDLGALDGADYAQLALIVAAACAGKLIGALVPARLLGLPWRDAADLALLMNTRGLTGLIILNAAVSLGILDGRMFTMLVITALATTALAGPLLSRREAPDRLPRESVAGVAGPPG